jgi:hypothetical protein
VAEHVTAPDQIEVTGWKRKGFDPAFGDADPGGEAMPTDQAMGLAEVVGHGIDALDLASVAARQLERMASVPASDVQDPGSLPDSESPDLVEHHGVPTRVKASVQPFVECRVGKAQSGVQRVAVQIV